MTTRSSIDLSELAYRALPFFARAYGGAGGTPGVADAAERRLARWRQTAAGGDPQLFEQRLAKDGLDVAAARAVLAAPTGHAAEVPPWIEILEASAAAAAAAEPARRSPPGAPLPFEEALLPLVSAAGARLEERFPRAWALVPAAAGDELRRRLLGRLSSLAAPALFLEFSIYRRQRESALTRLLRSGAESAPTELYRAFVGELSAGGLAAFWAAYPVLARLAGTVCLLWVDAVEAFLRHLEEDRERIAAVLNAGADPGVVTEVRPGVSDPHNGGRTAVVVGFGCGLKVIYKPHVLGMERCWFDLLRWMNAHGCPLPLKVLAVIDAGDHGWVEFAEQRPCADEAEAADYFRRAGMLLCLAYLLGGSDLHLENVVACGGQPVVVDLEMILQPARVESAVPASRAVAEVSGRLNESVLSTGLLPAWVDLPGGQVANLAGFGGAFDGGTRHLGWTRVNTDDMEREPVEGWKETRENRVDVGGRPVAAEQFVEEMIEGFASMYALVQERKRPLLAAGGPLEAFAHQQVRFVFRPTMVYGRVLTYLADPRFQRDGLDRSIEMDALARPFATGAVPDGAWALYRAERRAMERLDVPYFCLPADGDVVSGEGGEVAGIVSRSALAHARDRIEAVCEDDLRRQVEMMRLALSVAPSEGPKAARPAEARGRRRPDPPDVPQPPAAASLIEFARTIGRLVAGRAVRGDDGSAAWMAAAPADTAGHCRIQCLDHSLYDGAPGVAVFLAALGDRADEGFGDLARAALMSARAQLDQVRPRAAALVGIGAGGGLGGIVYGLTRAGRQLGDRSLLAEARAAASLITPQAIDSDELYDVIGGSAGAILSLLALYDVAGGDELLASADACGRRLLAGRVETPCGARAWRSLPDAPPLAGFAHGVAGIACALLRLFERTGDAAFRAAAVEAIEYERTLFVPEDGNWRDLRQPETPRAGMSAWCHGATGVGLARIGGLGTLDTPEVRSEIETAVRTTLALGAGPPYRLCCGLAGRVELLLEAAAVLGRPELRAYAGGLLGELLAQAGPAPESLVGPQRLSMFQGIAGIGYACLRVAAADRLAPLLLWRT